MKWPFVAPASTTALLAMASLALAQSPADLGKAEELFERGSALLNAGRYEEACPILEKAQSLATGIGVTLYLGECLEQTGHLVRALAEFDKAERLAAVKGDPRATVAHEREVALREKLSKLHVVVPPTAEVPAPVMTEDSATPEVSAPTAQTPATPASTAAVPLQPSLLHEDRTPTQRIAGVAVVGVGAAGIVAGTIFGLLAKSKMDDSNASGHCAAQDRCDPTGLAERADALNAATASTVLFVGGFACLAGGIALYLTAPADARKSIAVVPRAEWGGASLLLQRSW
jgi:tetratricopeptide (TPR) repeat protein